MTSTAGLDHGLTDYGDRDFSRYLRRSFALSMGYSRAMLDKPVVGIAYTGSDYNNCHRHFPELLVAVSYTHLDVYKRQGEDQRRFLAV